MFGYVNKESALNSGMTHHGSYYGIPVWVALEHPLLGFAISAKWIPLDYIIPMISSAEMFLRGIIFPDDVMCFQFKIKDKI